MNRLHLHATIFLGFLLVSGVTVAEVDATEDERTTVADTPVIEGGYSLPEGLMCCGESCGPGWSKPHKTYRPNISGSDGVVIGRTTPPAEELESAFAELDEMLAGCRALSLSTGATRKISELTGRLSVEFEVDRRGETTKTTIRAEETDISDVDTLEECVVNAKKGVTFPTSDDHELTIRRVWKVSYDTDSRVYEHPASELHGEQGDRMESTIDDKEVDVEWLEINGVDEELVKRWLRQSERHFASCYGGGLMRDRQLEGGVSLRYETSPTEDSDRLTVRESTLEDDRVVDCLKHSFPSFSRRMHERMSDGGEVELLVRLNFSTGNVDR